MRISFYNPHTVLGVTLFSYIFRKPTNKKNDFFLNILRNKKYNSALIVDGTSTSLTSGSTLIKFISENYIILKIISFFEIYIWCILNGINPFKKQIIFSDKKLNIKKDIIIGYGFLTDTFLNDDVAKKSFLLDFKGKKILHATHYFGRTRKISNNIKKTGTKYFISEANIKNNKYFSKYFVYIKKIYVLPFILRDRYKSITPFEKRLNKCFAIGTLLFLSDNKNIINEDNADYITNFKTNVLHTMRQEIYLNRKKLKKNIDCFIAPQINERHSNKPKFYDNWLLHKIWIKLINTDQKKYHNFDIVEKYNNYKMFICPEENIGLPSINFIEGMACGCAYIGLNDPMYNDIGMKNGMNYISYDGSLIDLKKKITYYQKHQKKLRIIAENGKKFVNKSFKEELVEKKFIDDMESFIKTSKLTSSFVKKNNHIKNKKI